MIGLLRGTVIERSSRGPIAEVMLDVNGVGYRVAVTPATAAGLSEREPVLLHIHTHVREDALVLYGFAAREERICFELLLTTHGVGTALALAILANLSPGALQVAVTTDDGDALTAVPGVGKKTAARLLIELKSKFEVADFDTGGVIAIPGGGPGQERADVRDGLSALGYAPDEIRAVLRDLPVEGTTAQLLRQALKLIGPRP